MLDSELTLEDKEVKKKSYVPLSIEKLVKDLYMKIHIKIFAYACFPILPHPSLFLAAILALYFQSL